MDQFINSLSSLHLTFKLSQEFSQKCEYSKSSTVVNELWDGMRMSKILNGILNQ